MIVMVLDIKAARQDISKEEQVLNVIRALLSQLQHWKNVNFIMTHFEHMKAFAEIQSHLQMEEECLKTFRSSNVALVTEGNRPKGSKMLTRFMMSFYTLICLVLAHLTI